MAAMTLVAMGGKAEEIDTLKAQKLQEVVVAGVRAKADAPFAVANISKQKLETFAKNGRELPMLLAQTPGILAWGENGLGTGAVGMRIRGAAGSRINVTLDGVALNSPEDQTVFWANMNSYAALLGSVQIQRGIGTSTNGDGAFGGSISLATAAPRLKPSLEISTSAGSYDTYNIGMKFSTGLLWDKFVFDGAYHETSTDGYIHGTDGRSGSYYGGLTYFGENLQVRYKNIGNFEKTGQAWNGVVQGTDDGSLANEGIRTYEDMYRAGLGKYNSLYETLELDPTTWTFRKDGNGQYITHRYRMDDGTYWKKTTDNFYQNHNILSASWRSKDALTHNAAMRYTYGFGYYSEFRPGDKFAKYGLTATDGSGQLVKLSDFVRKKGLSQHTYGIVYNINYKKNKVEIIGGLNLQQFHGSHFGYLTYVGNRGQVENYTGHRYYDAKARKNDYAGFVKTIYQMTDYLSLFADLQYRHVGYKTYGINDRFYDNKDGSYRNQILDIKEHYNFFNPKMGVSYQVGLHKLYASVAYASREPERNNFTDNGKYPAPNAEHLIDIEMGYQYTGAKWQAGANLYYMGYKDQFVQTGEKSDIGEYLTTNIKNSYRMGAELTAAYKPLKWLSIEGNAALSINRIKDFDEYVDNWKGNALKLHYDNSTLAFSPSAILNGFIRAEHKGFVCMWHTNYVSRQYLDNSENHERSLPAFTQTDVNLSYAWKIGKRGLKEIVYGMMISNLFNSHHAVSGWVYSAVSPSAGYTNDHRYYQIGFIPTAGTTLMANVTFKF